MAAPARLSLRPFTGAGVFYDRRLALPELVEFTRSVRFFLTSGMTLRDAMRVLSERGSRPVRGVAAGIAKDLAAGWSLEASIDRQGNKFPPLFKALATVGEETGNLPEVMADIEKYYQLQQALQRQLQAQIALPVLQFVAAVFIVAGLIAVLGELPIRSETGTERVDALGLGLIGTDGAVRFIVYVFGAVAVGLFTLWLLRRLLGGWPLCERLVLATPMLGPTVRAIALTRFSFTLQLMLDSTLSILRTIKLAFAATDNAAYIAKADRAEAMLRRGNTLTDTLVDTRMFSRDYISTVAIGEESGHLPEVMRQQAEYYDDLAKRKLAVLNKTLGLVVWLLVAGAVIFIIFRLFNNLYLGQLNKYLPK